MSNVDVSAPKSLKSDCDGIDVPLCELLFMFRIRQYHKLPKLYLEVCRVPDFLSYINEHTNER